MNKSQLYIALAMPFLMTACSVSVPDNATTLNRQANITPDYSTATLPCNIAPTNFLIEEEGEDFIVHLHTNKGTSSITTQGRTADIPINEWRTLMAEASEDTLLTDIYVKKDGSWHKYATRKNPVTADEADPYIAYRLIEPSYVDYEGMYICQRDITTFDEYVLMDNKMLSDGENGACVNCHSFQDYNRTERMQMHIRQNHGGTLISDGGKNKKVNLKTPETLSAGVYPAWHPTKNLIAYSVNETGQVFHTRHHQKIEVLDFASDLILYDVDKNEVYDIDCAPHDFETFPAWSPDGKTLYYASAHYVQTTSDIDAELGLNYQQLKYNILCRHFDEATLKFGEADTVFNAEAIGKSAVLPRISPDGNWLLFSMADYGNFHVWHHSSDLYVMNLATREVRPLTAANSTATDSYHSWSSNGRWILFTTRRDDGNYTRLYMAYFDRQGNIHPAFPLPQQDPLFSQRFFKSYNVPEWLVQPVKDSRNQLVNAIKTDATPAQYKGSSLLSPEKKQQAKPKQSTETTSANRVGY